MDENQKIPEGPAPIVNMDGHRTATERLEFENLKAQAIARQEKMLAKVAWAAPDLVAMTEIVAILKKLKGADRERAETWLRMYCERNY